VKVRQNGRIVSVAVIVAVAINSDGRGPSVHGVRNPARRSEAVRKFGVKLRMPRRANALFMRLIRRVRSATSPSRSRPGCLGREAV
jgi:hypothetical protein